LPSQGVTVVVLRRDHGTGLPKFDNPKMVDREVKLLLTLDDLSRMDYDVVDDLGLTGTLNAMNKELD
jgi:hypothetical protein